MIYMFWDLLQFAEGFAKGVTVKDFVCSVSLFEHSNQNRCAVSLCWVFQCLGNGFPESVSRVTSILSPRNNNGRSYCWLKEDRHKP